MSDGVAIVGMSCRVPSAANLGELWTMLRGGGDAITDGPTGRAAPGERGGFLDGVHLFDEVQFEVSPREAAAMDPQQRLALELSWEALEDAALDPRRIAPSRGAVLFGVMAGDYEAAVSSETLSPYTMTGTARGLIANRVSYFYGFTGLSLTVDTAQASSLTAVHLACDALRSGAADLALVGGVNLNLSPLGGMMAERLGALSPDGRAYVFDARANGFVRGEGGAVVVLRPLSHAQDSGDRVYAVIRGSATSTGSGPGLTVPNAVAQEAAIRGALAIAELAPAEIAYVELHGTGTPVGDPIEAAALGAVYGAERQGTPLSVGSIKTNIGHLGAAAGIAGLVKTALCLHNRELVPSLNFSTAHPQIPLDRLGLRVVVEPSRWPLDSRAAGVSSFGMGGANCHVVLSFGPEPASRRVSDGPHAWLLAGRSEESVRAQASEVLNSAQALAPQDVGYTLARRAKNDWSGVVVGEDREELVEGLKRLHEGVPGDAVRVGRRRDHKRIAFVFSGQGSVWAGMGLELWRTNAGFAASMDACERALSEHVEWSLREVLGSADELGRIEIAQPAGFALAVSLAALWRTFGVKPAMVVGHSQGEVAAAHVAGALSLGDAVKIITTRSLLFSQRGPVGGMVFVAAPVERTRRLLERLGGPLAVAAINGPASTIVTGPHAALDEFTIRLDAEGIRHRRVQVDRIGHAAELDGLRVELVEALQGIRPARTEIAFVSTVTGERVATDQLDADYWGWNLREPVRFEQATRTLLRERCTALLEISPHPVLGAAIQETASAEVHGGHIAVLGSLRRDQGGLRRFLTSLVEAHVAGINIDWSPLHANNGARVVSLPGAVFKRRSHWIADAAQPGTVPASATPGLPAAATFGGASVDTVPRPTGLDTLTLVLAHAAAVLGHDGAESIDPQSPFKRLGLNSVGAVDLRDRLAEATGLSLPVALIYDFPTPEAVASHLRSRFSRTTEAETLAEAVTSLERLAGTTVPRGQLSEQLAARLRRVASRLEAESGGRPTSPGFNEDVDAASDEELFGLIDTGGSP